MGIFLNGTKSIITPELAMLILESIVAGYKAYFKKVDLQSQAICSAIEFPCIVQPDKHLGFG